MNIAVESHVYASLNIGGNEVPFITDAVITMWIVMLIIIIPLAIITRKFETVPKGAQKYLEGLVTFVRGITAPMGHHAKTFTPFICTLLLFLIVSNIMAIFNVIPSGKFLADVFNNPSLEHFEFSLHPPTKNFNVTACLAIISILIVIISEFKYKGVRGWARGFYKPSIVFGFVKVMDLVVRPLSLCLRLFGNILGGYISMSLLYAAMPLFLPAVIGLYFDLFDGLLQGYIFVFLLSLYIAEAVEEPETA